MSDEEKIKESHITANTVPNNDEPWTDFQYRLYKAHRESYWVGKASFHSLSNVVNINPTWLWAETKYMICGIVENVYTNFSSFSTATFTTSEMWAPQYWSITFLDHLVEVWHETINYKASFYQGVNPARNFYDKRTQALQRRRLQSATNEDGDFVTTTTFFYILSSDRNQEHPDPSLLAYVDPKYYDDLTADLASTFPNVVLSVQNERLLSRITPEWKKIPALHDYGSDWISYSMSQASAG